MEILFMADIQVMATLTMGIRITAIPATDIRVTDIAPVMDTLATVDIRVTEVTLATATIPVLIMADIGTISANQT